MYYTREDELQEINAINVWRDKLEAIARERMLKLDLLKCH